MSNSRVHNILSSETKVNFTDIRKPTISQVQIY